MTGGENDSYNSIEMSEEEANASWGNEWNQVLRGGRAKRLADHQRKKEGGRDRLESEGRDRGLKNPELRALNVVVRFEEEGGAKKSNPLKLTKIRRMQVGEVKYSKVTLLRSK